jgi:ACR3 family arsenite transporter
VAIEREDIMGKNDSAKIGFFEKYLTIWVVLCMVIGVLIGMYLPGIPDFLGRFEYANVSIPIAILIWLMIYPMMLKVDFQSIKNVGKNPKGLFVTWVTNWMIKPFTMFGIAWLFFFVIFRSLIPAELAQDYLAGAILLGAAPCTAMVFVWSYLTKGNPAYTVVQVATNDLIILIAFTPIVAFLLGVGGVTIPWDTLILSVILFVVIPLAGGIITRNYITKKRGLDYFEKSFIPKFGNITTIGLLLTLIIIFSFQGDVILNNPLHIVLIAIPLIIQTFLIFFIAYLATLTVREFIRELALSLGEEPSYRKGESIRKIQKAIANLYYERRITPVIVLDELHLASTAVLSELRLIFNFNMDSENPFIVILAGQPALRVVLSYNIHTPLRQRIALVHTMRGLAKEETSKYIESRLKMAGCKSY